MDDVRDELSHSEFHERAQDVYWHKAPSCGSKGPHGARCVRQPGHLGRYCEGNGIPDPYGPKYYRWHRDD
jgi:hypothetical protein